MSLTISKPVAIIGVAVLVVLAVTRLVNQETDRGLRSVPERLAAEAQRRRPAEGEKTARNPAAPEDLEALRKLTARAQAAAAKLEKLRAADGARADRILTEEDAVYCPMAEGAEWVFDWVISAPGEVRRDEMHRVQGSSVTLGGKVYGKQRTWSGNAEPPGTPEELVRQDATGFYGLEPNANGGKEYCLVPFPLKPGTSRQTFTVDGVPSEIRVLGVETVTAAGKTYEQCYHLQTTAAGMTDDSWLAPHVGLVQSRVALSDGTAMFGSLRSFTAGKK